MNRLNQLSVNPLEECIGLIQDDLTERCKTCAASEQQYQYCKHFQTIGRYIETQLRERGRIKLLSDNKSL